MNRHWPAQCPPTGFLPADAIRHWSAAGGHDLPAFFGPVITGEQRQLKFVVRHGGALVCALVSP